MPHLVELEMRALMALFQSSQELSKDLYTSTPQPLLPQHATLLLPLSSLSVLLQ